MSSSLQNREELKYKFLKLSRQEYVAYYSSLPLHDLIDHHEALSTFLKDGENDTKAEIKRFNDLIVQIDLEILKKANKQKGFYYLLENHSGMPFMNQSGCVYLYVLKENAEKTADFLNSYKYDVLLDYVDFDKTDKMDFFYEMFAVNGARGVILEELPHYRGMIIGAEYLLPNADEVYSDKKDYLNPEFNLANTLYNQYNPNGVDYDLTIAEQHQHYYALRVDLYRKLFHSNFIMPLQIQTNPRYISLINLAETLNKLKLKDIPISTVEYNGNRYISLYTDWYHHDKIMFSSSACKISVQNLVTMIGKDKLFSSYRGIIINPGYSNSLIITKKLYDLIVQIDQENI